MTSANAKVTILVDNQAGDGLTAEHGLSLWIETEGKRILFDTGQGIALVSNSRALGVDLGETDILVLSHGHYDHTGGIPQVLRQAPNTEVYCHPGIVYPRYSIRNGMPKPIQIPHESMAALDKLPPQKLHWIIKPLLLSERIGITGPIPRETSYEDTGEPFYLDPEGKHADPVDDDLALWIRTDKGLVICVGCSHAGLVNTLNYVLRLNPDSRIQAVIGGFHLLHASIQRLNHTIASLQSMQPDMMVPCHCTGDNAIRFLRNGLNGNVLSCSTGTCLTFS